MAFTHGKNTYFSLGSAGSESTEVDISSYLSEVGFPSSIETAETTTFGQDTKTYVIGLRDATISLSGIHDPTVDAQLSGAIGNAIALNFTYSPEGNQSGDVTYSGAAYITSYEISSGVSDMVGFSAELQVTGSVTRGTV